MRQAATLPNTIGGAPVLHVFGIDNPAGATPALQIGRNDRPIKACTRMGFLRFLGAMKNYLKIAAIVTLVLSSLAMPARQVNAADDDQYTFKVHNAYKERITKLLASEDGKDYIAFDIGKGIDVGETVTLNWDKSTNKSGCKWYLKAVYADKSVGEAVRFDFCEEDLVIDF